ncbi:neuronal acetylcholine receptor subunit alpha-10-like isoform X2 [Physella acuta]|uniref:neuronal acetylcholine receptor subunit alpha-10-like isoform X2 n=1 Tax=Physella acuta TaxID=109671 RepID=UPI0027DAC254|nr:neuronal acetylcholine receptor subunit alpha-10-like isoform X2 [Physella acuta]
MNLNQTVCFISGLLCSTMFGIVHMSHEKRLIRDLIGNYSERGKMGRPVAEQNDTITISYGMSLIQILDLDERNQILTTNVWATYNWNDMYLVWNESEYGDITTVRVNNNDIWKPDIKLYNYADTRLEEKREALCVLSSNGDVVWIPQAVFKSSCSIDIRHFPFDIQTCRMKFGSWTYDGSKLDLQFLYTNVTGFEMTDYILSNEWDILESSAKRNVKYYPCCPEPYVDLVFKLVIRRKVAFYSYILILPCVLLSSVTLVLFWLPPESPAKMQLGMNIFVAFFVLLLLLAESTPPAASSIPLIGAYYCLNMIMITMSTLLSAVVVNLYFHGPGTKVPRVFRRLMLDFFARVFCMQKTLMDKKERVERRNSIAYSANNDANAVTVDQASNGRGGNNVNLNKNNKDKRHHVDFKYDRVGVFELQPDENWRPRNYSMGSETDLSDRIVPLPSHLSQLEADVREIKLQLKRLEEKGAAKAHKEYLAREWKLVALVLDRLFFFVYLVAIVVSALALFETTMFQTGSVDESDT